jgi:hypothetical protein
MPALLLPSPIVFLSGLVIVAAIVGAFAIARTAGRRSRLGAHARERALMSSFQGYLEARTGSDELRRASNAVEGPAFWTALETYAARLTRSDWRRLAVALERSPHERVERRALRDDSPWRRELAARRLGLLHSRASRRALRVALERGPAAVTLAAARSLARGRDGRALRWILAHPERLASRGRPIWTGLLRSFGHRARPVLAAELERGPLSPELECALIDSLGIGRFAPAARAIAARLGRTELEVRLAAVRALGMLEEREHEASLLAALQDPAWQVRAQAARALGRMGTLGALASLTGSLTDRSWWVRRHAAYALRDLGPEGQAALRRVFETSPDPYARDIAEEALSGGLKASA